MRRAEQLAFVALAALTPRAVALAHPAPAEPPLFAPLHCIVRADAQREPNVRIEYAVAFDDTQLDADDIALPDSHRHQFFALRGAIAGGALGPELVPAEPSGESRAEARWPLPLWINQHDIDRAAAAIGDGGAMFMPSEVPSGSVLDTHEALSTRAVRIDMDGARRPITSEQAARGVDLAIDRLEPGLYTVAAYIFSPPFNGWAFRPEPINVVQQQHIPAAVIAPIASVLRGGQGRRVHACIDAPEGTRVHGAYFVLERPELGWRTWLEEQALPDEARTELCFRADGAQLSGSVRLRLQLRAPDGSESVFYSPDTLTALPGSAGCQASEHVCCAAIAAHDAGATPAHDPSEVKTSESRGLCSIAQPPAVRVAQPSAWIFILLLGVLRAVARRCTMLGRTAHATPRGTLGRPSCPLAVAPLPFRAKRQARFASRLRRASAARTTRSKRWRARS